MSISGTPDGFHFLRYNLARDEDQKPAPLGRQEYRATQEQAAQQREEEKPVPELVQ
jgi:hypothetical protein